MGLEKTSERQIVIPSPTTRTSRRRAVATAAAAGNHGLLTEHTFAVGTTHDRATPEAATDRTTQLPPEAACPTCAGTPVRRDRVLRSLLEAAVPGAARG